MVRSRARNVESKVWIVEMDLSLCLYRKYRPRKFSELVGQTVAKKTLMNAVKTGRVSHAYLFSGPRGTGKTTAARLLGKALNCLSHKDGEPCCRCDNCRAVDEGAFIDLIEIDAASTSSIDDIRDLREKVRYAPARGRYKVYIVDEAHQLRGAAAHAFLKTLEEPPQHVVFVLATTEPHKFLETILSRCQQFDFKRISIPDIVNRLRTIADAEDIEVSNECLSLIARGAEGGMRDAISLMDQVESFEVKRISLETVEDLLGTVREEICSEILSSIVNGKRDRLIEMVDNLMAAGRDPYQLVGALTEHIRKMIRVRLGVDREGFYENDRKDATSLSVTELTGIMESLFNCLRDMRLTKEEGVALDLMLMELINSRGEAKKTPVLDSKVPLQETGDQKKSYDQPKPVSRKAAVKEQATVKKKSKPVLEVPDEKVQRRKKMPLPELAVELAKELRQSSEKEQEGESVQDAVSCAEEEIFRLSHDQAPSVPEAVSFPAAEGAKNSVLSQLMDKLKSNNKMQIHALLKEAVGEKVIGETMHIYFPDKYRFHVEKLKTDSKRLLLEDMVGKILGDSYRVEAEIMTKKAGEPERQEDGAMEKDLLDHPTVKKVQKLFGGKIVGIKED